MMKNLAVLFLLVNLWALRTPAQSGLDYYLPQDVTYDVNIPTPKSVLGYEVGDWHVRPDQIVTYLQALARASDRCQFQIYGRTHEGRPQVILTISAKENLARLPEIREQREQLRDPNRQPPAMESMPVVLWIGYSVHGDEPSGANASLLYAYHLAAAQGARIEALLRDSIVLLDPCLNPDGLGRFAHWANMHHGKRAIADPNHREHRQPWPSGRSNHYWFDLNRDWLLGQNPESQARLRVFHAWRPNIVTDFHEMGTNSSYFFQPGVRSRHNPLIPAKNYDLTARVAQFHAQALDEIGSLYYTRESYDDFYFGKGSTYPDVHGSVGILFEQASSRGHAQMNRFGKLTFPFTIRNQLKTSLSSHEAALNMRLDLLEYQREFCKSALDAAAADDTKAWVFSSPESPSRASKLVELLGRHHIEVKSLRADFAKGKLKFKANEAFVVVGRQPQYRLLKSLFEIRTEFLDPVFYDVSAWNMFAAFDLDYVGLDAREIKSLDMSTLKMNQNEGGVTNAVAQGAPQPYAFMFHWSSFEAAKLLNRLLDQGVEALALGSPLAAQLCGDALTRKFDRGSIVIPRGVQTLPFAEVSKIVDQEARTLGTQVFAIKSGMTKKGVELGSPTVGSLRPVKALIVVGDRVSSYEAGEVWHLLDARLGVRTSLIEGRQLERLNLANYTHILGVSGSESALGKKKDDLKRWLSRGGILITQRSAARWAGTDILGLKAAKSKTKEKKKVAAKVLGTYADRNKNSAKRRIGGAIFKASLDITHPLGWGFADSKVALWRKGTTPMLASKGSTSNPMRYLKDPLLSGFASATAQKSLAETPAASVDRVGAGVVVRFADDMNFRAYWRGTERLYLNAIFHARCVAGSGRALSEGNRETQHH